MTEKEFVSRAESFADENGMLDGADSVLVGYSGGADSTALLFCMRAICVKRGMKLYALHVNHMIRGEEADRDEEHCRVICEKYGIEFSAVHINIPEIAEREGLGTEEAARRERYAAFERFCADKHISRIAVAHNSGDNMETVLFNLIRGSGMKGLCGIPPVRGNIIRPLLQISREDIVRYVEMLGLTYVTDSTNNEDEYTRNYLRHEICPRLKKLVPAAESNISRGSAIMREENALLDELASEGDERLLSRRIMAEYNAYCGGTLESKHVRDSVKLVKAGVLWSEISLPGLVKLRITREGYEFRRDDRGGSGEDFTAEKGIFTSVGEKNGTEIHLPDGSMLKTEKNNAHDINVYKLSICHTLNSAKIKGSVYARFRREGDFIVSGHHRKSVKKLLCEKKVPPDERGSLPFLCDDEGILWIPGVALRDGVSGKDDDIIVLWKK